MIIEGIMKAVNGPASLHLQKAVEIQVNYALELLPCIWERFTFTASGNNYELSL